jgi:hypothetical protein
MERLAVPPPGSKNASSINPIVSSGGGIRAGIGSRSAANTKAELGHQKRNSVIHQVSSQKQKHQQPYSHSQIKIAKMVNHLVQKR